MKVLIILENLRIGGIERNALDQVYQLKDSNDSGVLLVLNKSRTLVNANFLHTDEELIASKKIDIRFTSTGFFQRISVVNKILRTEKIDLIIDYSLIGTVIARIANILAAKRIVVNCVVQQLASLSSPIQRFKRMFYAQFATNLFMNSVNYGNDWDFHVSRNLVSKFFFRKRFKIIRNGVYLPRLMKRNIELRNVAPTSIRFIFLGRLKYWKGLNNFKFIDNACEGNANFLVITSENDPSIVQYLKDSFGSRVTFIIGKNLDDFVPQKHDIHIYPVDYGPNPPAIESVSTNCLEMALLGIPSMVTEGGTANWLELKAYGFIHEVNWSDVHSILQGIKQCRSLLVTSNLLNKVARAVDVSNNVSEHLKYA